MLVLRMTDEEKRLARRIGTTIRKLREVKGWSQAELAEAVHLSTPYAALLDRGERLPSLPVLIRVADVLGITLDTLVGRSKVEDGWSAETLTVLQSAPPHLRPVALAIFRVLAKAKAK